MKSPSEYPFPEIPPVSRGVSARDLITYQGITYYVDRKESQEKDGGPWEGWPGKPEIIVWVRATDNTHTICLCLQSDGGITEIERIENKD